jgi:hypothetical protein
VRACWSWQSWRLICSFSSVSQLCLEIFRWEGFYWKFCIEDYLV